MADASPALFRPTWQQALGRGLYLGSLVAVAGIVVVLLAAAASAWSDAAAPPLWVWVSVAAGPPVTGALLAVPTRGLTGTQISARGIRTLSALPRGGRRASATWSEVVDVRAERRGGRTVVSVYLKSGASVQLHAPYSGELFAADPRFEGKMFALSHLWRSHRFGGLPG